MKKPETLDKPKGQVFDTMRAAAGALKLPMRVLKTAKAQGCPAFRGTRVYGDELLAWLDANPVAQSADPKDEKLLEEIRKLRLANDAKAGRLVERAWVVERIHRLGGEVNAVRAKSEAEHPLRFAAAAGDVAKCRTVLRSVWDDILRSIAVLRKHLEEGSGRT